MLVKCNYTKCLKHKLNDTAHMKVEKDHMQDTILEGVLVKKQEIY